MKNFIHIRNKCWNFFVSGDADVKSFRDALPNIDAIILNSQILKHSRTTDAAAAEIPGFDRKVFIKRTNNKGIRFTLRYLFRKARVFRAAKAASRLDECCIPTPKVLAVGEKRFFFFLRAGYIITEFMEKTPQLSDSVAAANYHDAAPLAEKAAELIHKIHSAGVIHGDCKLQNFYLTDKGEAAVWDLDGARVFRAKPPEKLIRKDLDRFKKSCEKENPALAKLKLN